MLPKRLSLNQLLTTDVQELAPELEAYQSIFAGCFGRREQKEKYHTYMNGLLQQLPNKSIETMMLHNDGDDPNSIRAMQHFTSQGAWDDVAVFLDYASRHGYTLLDRRLYMPLDWFEDEAFAERRRQCFVSSKATIEFVGNVKSRCSTRQA